MKNSIIWVCIGEKFCDINNPYRDELVKNNFKLLCFKWLEDAINFFTKEKEKESLGKYGLIIERHLPFSEEERWTTTYKKKDSSGIMFLEKFIAPLWEGTTNPPTVVFSYFRLNILLKYENAKNIWALDANCHVNKSKIVWLYSEKALLKDNGMSSNIVVKVNTLSI